MKRLLILLALLSGCATQPPALRYPNPPECVYLRDGRIVFEECPAEAT